MHDGASPLNRVLSVPKRRTEVKGRRSWFEAVVSRRLRYHKGCAAEMVAETVARAEMRLQQ